MEAVALSVVGGGVGILMGIGASERPRAVRWAKAKYIAVTWVITIPGAALVAIQTYALVNLYLGSPP